MVHQGVNKHVYHKSGEAKTACTSYVLGALGIHPDTYHYSGYAHQWSGVLRRNGYAVRSRKSVTKTAKTVGALRAIIKKNSEKWGDPADTKYIVLVVCGNGVLHLILLGRDGQTLVDTAPVKRDRRRILGVQAAFKV